jgi:hypothetical protein
MTAYSSPGVVAASYTIKGRIGTKVIGQLAGSVGNIYGTATLTQNGYSDQFPIYNLYGSWADPDLVASRSGKLQVLSGRPPVPWTAGSRSEVIYDLFSEISEGGNN